VKVQLWLKKRVFKGLILKITPEISFPERQRVKIHLLLKGIKERR